MIGCQHWHTSLGSVTTELRRPAAMAGKGTAKEYVKLCVSPDANLVSVWDRINVDAFLDTPGRPAVKT